MRGPLTPDSVRGDGAVDGSRELTTDFLGIITGQDSWQRAAILSFLLYFG